MLDKKGKFKTFEIMPKGSEVNIWSVHSITFFNGMYIYYKNGKSIFLSDFLLLIYFDHFFLIFQIVSVSFYEEIVQKDFIKISNCQFFFSIY